LRENDVRVFKTKDFARFARKERIGDDALCESIARAERGLIDADLGGGLIKQRAARKGAGPLGRLSNDNRLPKRRTCRIPSRLRKEHDGQHF
jgi:hypothetical protein